MIENKKVGIVVLFVGVFLLLFTFFNAYVFLREDVVIVATSGLVDLFGEALGPLIGTCVRVMYLAIMGWISSVLTIRGVQLWKVVDGSNESKTIPGVSAQRKTRTATKKSLKRAGERNEV